VLDDELLDHGEVHVSQVHQQLPQPPALQLGALDLQGLSQRLRRESPTRHQAYAEHGPPAGNEHGVDLAVPQEDLGLVTLLVAHEQAPGRRLCREVVQH
jgi:hypothetical protein